MASNFGIAVDRSRDGFGLKLTADFDATSAYELISKPFILAEIDEAIQSVSDKAILE